MEGLIKEDFTYRANAEGYMIYYKSIGIGGASIKGEFKGSGNARFKQMKDHGESAKREIDSYMRGNMPTYIRDHIKGINISKEQNKTV